MAKPGYPGLSRSTFKFIRNLARNNNREWFKENKERYIDDVVEPVTDFIEAMEPRLHAISEYFVADPRPHGGSMFRIYRDTRFSKDKRPYKEHVGCQFRHEAGKDAHAPGFYVHIAPGEILFGGGIWTPPGDTLFQIRTAITERPKAWQRIITDPKIKKRFGGVSGDGLKRPPRGFEPDHPHLEDIMRKTWFVMQPCDEDLACSPGFITEVERAFKAASPLLEFLTKAVKLPY